MSYSILVLFARQRFDFQVTYLIMARIALMRTFSLIYGAFDHCFTPMFLWYVQLAIMTSAFITGKKQRKSGRNASTICGNLNQKNQFFPNYFLQWFFLNFISKIFLSLRRIFGTFFEKETLFFFRSFWMKLHFEVNSVVKISFLICCLA